jgi:hypothetical protein
MEFLIDALWPETGERYMLFSWMLAGQRQGTDTCPSSSGTFSSTRWAAYKGTGSQVEIDGAFHGCHVGGDRGEIHALLMDASWAETGDRYMPKLFRDFLFHQVGSL